MLAAAAEATLPDIDDRTSEGANIPCVMPALTTVNATSAMATYLTKVRDLRSKNFRSH